MIEQRSATIEQFGCSCQAARGRNRGRFTRYVARKPGGVQEKRGDRPEEPQPRAKSEGEYRQWAPDAARRGHKSRLAGKPTSPPGPGPLRPLLDSTSHLRIAEETTASARKGERA